MSRPSVERILDLIGELSDDDRERFDQQFGRQAMVERRQEVAGAGGEATARMVGRPSIDEAIEESREILDVPDDWDGEGTPAYSRATWERATSFVTHYAQRLWVEHGIRIPAPKILPGPDGSIDVHWEQESFELLVNVPAESTQRAEFYGDDYGTIYIKGSLDPAALNRGLIEWFQKAS